MQAQHTWMPAHIIKSIQAKVSMKHKSTTHGDAMQNERPVMWKKH